jgi:hypothetical protein
MMSEVYVGTIENIQPKNNVIDFESARRKRLNEETGQPKSHSALPDVSLPGDPKTSFHSSTKTNQEQPFAKTQPGNTNEGAQTGARQDHTGTQENDQDFDSNRFNRRSTFNEHQYTVSDYVNYIHAVLKRRPLDSPTPFMSDPLINNNDPYYAYRITETARRLGIDPFSLNGSELKELYHFGRLRSDEERKEYVEREIKSRAKLEKYESALKDWYRNENMRVPVSLLSHTKQGIRSFFNAQRYKELMAIARRNATLPITELVKENPILWESMTRTGSFKRRPFEAMGKTISEFLAFFFDLICGGMEGLSEEENAWN